MSLNLEKQLVFYGAYHHNRTNIGIHIVCVPIIAMTILLLASNAPAVPLPSWISIPNLPLDISSVLAVVYSVLYILMEPVAGSLVAPLIIGGCAYMHHLAAAYGSTANYWAGALNVASWIAQFVGHGKFEGRAPALLDNLVQAFFLAPFFVWFELLFFFGYRPDLQGRLSKAVEKERAKLDKEEQKSSNGSAKESKKAV